MKGDRRKKTVRDQELRRLASKIRDVAHLDNLVQQADPKMQNALRGLMMQHVKFDASAATEVPEPIREPHPLLAPPVCDRIYSFLTL